MYLLDDLTSNQSFTLLLNSDLRKDVGFKCDVNIFMWKNKLINYKLIIFLIYIFLTKTGSRYKRSVWVRNFSVRFASLRHLRIRSCFQNFNGRKRFILVLNWVYYMIYDIYTIWLAVVLYAIWLVLEVRIGFTITSQVSPITASSIFVDI